MAGLIPQHFIDELLARTDIAEVIDRRVPLTRAGSEFKACCPFHDEKTPSFTVSPVKQFYHCFGCGAHGTAIGFLMDYANLSFPEAVEELAAGAGVTVPVENEQRPTGEHETTNLVEILAEAARWFQSQLRRHPEAQQAIDYLKGRGLSGETAAAFGLGYAPEAWDGLLQALGAGGERRKQLLQAGLIISKESGGAYDRFRGRVMFPIEDHRGRIVAFGGRILGDGEPKYLNSPETPLFHKGSELFGLHRARRSIGGEQRSIVVEGYMDVVSLSQFGVENAVATLGTATTRPHLQRLFRLAPEIVFCFDGDRAGRAAAWRALETALPEMRDGRQIGFLFLPEGEDPDTVVRAEGADAFRARIADAMSLPDYFFKELTGKTDRSRMDGNASFVKQSQTLLQRLPAGALREMMLQRLSTLSGLATDYLQGSQPQTATPLRRARRRALPDQPGQLTPLALATSLLLQDPQLCRSVELPTLEQSGLPGAEILQQLFRILQQEPELSTARLLERFRGATVHPHLEKLAARNNLMEEESLAEALSGTIAAVEEAGYEQEIVLLLQKARSVTLNEGEKQRLSGLLTCRREARARRLKVL
ncbi:MAG: DNA primase [Pseudomonadota bacterium]|nr:DNA primase [Pseudomonadota bacterium]